MSRRDQYGDPEDYRDPWPWWRERSPVFLVVLVLYGISLLGLLAWVALYVLGRMRA